MNHGISAIGAIDIGGTKIAVGLVSTEGKILTQTEFPTNTDDPLQSMAQIASALRKQLLECAIGITSVGIGCTGPVHPANGTVGEVALLPGWTGFDLREALEQAFLVPVAVENDCDAAALAESKWGAGAGLNRFLFVSLSTGIGAGLVLDGQIYRGANGAHPELGHMTIDPSGPACYCGSAGCWESLVSGTALANQHNLDAAETFALARQGNLEASLAIQKFTFYLGIALANLTTLYAVERIALGGGLMRSSDLFLDNAIQIAIARSRLIPKGTVTIVPAAFGTDAGLIGAAAVGHLYLKAEQGASCKPL